MGRLAYQLLTHSANLIRLSGLLGKSSFMRLIGLSCQIVLRCLLYPGGVNLLNGVCSGEYHANELEPRRAPFGWREVSCNQARVVCYGLVGVLVSELRVIHYYPLERADQRRTQRPTR